MKSITIKGYPREDKGKAASKALRDAGKIPCVLYGSGEVLHFSADVLSFNKLVYTPEVHTVVVEVEGGKSYYSILQDIQFHPVTDKILHIDFYELKQDKEITMDIPVKITGTSPGVLSGGNLRTNYRHLKVKTIPANLPDYIEVDISKLNVGDKFYITELHSGKYKFLHPDNMVICYVRTSRKVVEAPADGKDAKKK